VRLGVFHSDIQYTTLEVLAQAGSRLDVTH
jgi:hypothetical protein